ncbi:unnamed protein product (macronuclear) [Paramecium tetraurelia]|uniref:Transmembrane protein n=1 Tax=Paramecium tetraurelia TaxID=5888 RepID=A0E6R3_PARTE|nr:uncharacterized protein GSPATT00023708001 [Paramecium tetraurelia]CAK90980.1 unnamed protein product [Paramecium tetraurelia]|eukprot:XP_001458377.1 hypothetical protein (macronuclear) [Paramecium tetraurelia strain d4-2]
MMSNLIYNIQTLTFLSNLKYNVYNCKSNFITPIIIISQKYTCQENITQIQKKGGIKNNIQLINFQILSHLQSWVLKQYQQIQVFIRQNFQLIVISKQKIQQLIIVQSGITKLIQFIISCRRLCLKYTMPYSWPKITRATLWLYFSRDYIFYIMYSFWKISRKSYKIQFCSSQFLLIDFIFGYRYKIFQVKNKRFGIQNLKRGIMDNSLIRNQQYIMWMQKTILK